MRRCPDSIKDTAVRGRPIFFATSSCERSKYSRACLSRSPSSDRWSSDLGMSVSLFLLGFRDCTPLARLLRFANFFDTGGQSFDEISPIAVAALLDNFFRGLKANNVLQLQKYAHGFR